MTALRFSSLLSGLSTRLPLPLILGIGLLLRIGYASLMQENLLAADGMYYLGTAKHILAGDAYSPLWPPGLPYVLALFMGIGGEHLAAVVAGMLLIYIAFSVLLHDTMRKWSNEQIAGLFSLVFAVSPAFIHHSVAPLTHLPVALCLLVMAISVWELRNGGGTRHLLRIGLALGTAILIRPGSLFLLPVLMGLLLLYVPTPGWKKAFHLCLPFVLAGMMVVAWEIQVYHMTGRIVWINDANSSNFHLGNHPDTPLYKTWWLGSHDESQNPRFADFYAERRRIKARPPAEQGPLSSQLTRDHIRQAPGWFVLRSFHRVRCFFAFDTFTGATLQERFPHARVIAFLVLILDGLTYLLIATLALLGSSRSLQSGQPGRILWFLTLAYAFPYFIAFSHPTYHLPIVPLLALMAAKGLSGGDLATIPRRTRQYLMVALLIFWGIQGEWVWQMAFKAGP